MKIPEDFLPVEIDDKTEESDCSIVGANGPGFLQEELEYMKKAINNFPEAIELIEYFVRRVEEGSIRSKTTYGKFKTFLNKIKNE